MALQHERWISLEEYHEIERASEVKYEYSDGRIYDMSGGTSKHSRIAINMTIAFELHLRGKDCRVFNSDMKVLPLDSENPSYFPDVTITCNPAVYQDKSTVIRSPRLVVEVLSPSTASRDRGEKLLVYQSCMSIEDYVIVGTQRQQVEVYHRESTDDWHYRCYTAQQSVVLTSIGLTVPVAEIFANTDVPPIASVLSTD